MFKANGSLSRFQVVSILAMIMIVALIMQMPHPGTVTMAQSNLKQPNVTGTGTVVSWTAGTLNNGGHAVVVTAGTASVTTSKADCSAPAYAGCNFVYSNSSGTVAVTTAVATAMASGNSLMAYVETSGSAITKLSFPLQASTAGLARLVQNCGTTVTCANTSAGPSLVEAYGSVALTSGTPSTASLVQLPFTSSTSYVCTASPVGTSAAIAAAGIAVNQTSGTATTLTGPNTVTTTVNYRCSGT